MSATGRSDVRHPDDFYATPAWASLAILRALQIPTDVAIFDPCCGDGAILDVAAKLGHPTEGLEIDDGRASAAAAKGHVVTRRDALTPAEWPGNAALVTNPPFSLAMDFVERSKSEGRYSLVAMLLRLPWLASAGRAEFHRTYPSEVNVLSRRPEFAASIKCKGRKRTKGDPRPDCTWAVLQPIAAPRFAACPLCGSKVDTVTTDSTDYAWFVWGAGRGGRWSILDLGGAS